MNHQLHITAWPGGPLFEPAVASAPAAQWIRNDVAAWAPHPYRLTGERVEWGPVSADRTFPVPARLYLRELGELDLVDAHQVFGFYLRFGALGVHRPGQSLIPADHPLVEEVDRAWLPHERQSGRRHFEHLDEFRWHAALIRSLTTLYHEISTGRPDPATAWDGEWFPPPAGPGARGEFFVTWINRLIAPLRPRVGLEANGDPPSPGAPTLLAALAIQLFNDVAAGTRYKACANERCRRLFVNQTGPDGVRRTRTAGVVYCSARCARAQAQRSYRRRRQAGE